MELKKKHILKRSGAFTAQLIVQKNSRTFKISITRKGPLAIK
jgi:hypothetical protein